jgi:hypothetical protein
LQLNNKKTAKKSPKYCLKKGVLYILLKEGLINKPSKSKIAFVEKLKADLGVRSLTEEFRNFTFNIHHHRSDSWIDKMKKAISQ